MKTIITIASRSLILCLPAMAVALQPLEDAELSNVTGQDGLVIDIASKADQTGFGYDDITLTVDRGQPAERKLQFAQATSADFPDGLRPGFYTVDDDGAFVNGPTHIKMSIDAGAKANLTPYMAFQLDIFGLPEGMSDARRTQLILGELSHGPGDSKTYGAWALEGDGILRLVNERGIFNANSTDASVFGEIIHGRMYHRQTKGGKPDTTYLILDNLHARWDMPKGTYGINKEGLIMKTAPNDVIDVALDFDIFFKQGGLDFTAGGNGVLHFGWKGGLLGPELLWRTKGTAGDDTPSALNLSSKWNFVPADSELGNEFKWRLGETGGASSPQDGNKRIQFELSDWATWGSHDYGHDFPVIGLDVINQEFLQGKDYALCFKGTVGSGGCTGQVVNLVPGKFGGNEVANGLALVIRDGNLQSYSRRVNVVEEVWSDADDKYVLLELPQYNAGKSPGVTRSIDWGLIYTLADIDGNIFLYPGGNPGDGDNGLRADIIAVSNTFEEETDKPGFNWDHGSHLMIAETRIDDTKPMGATRNAMGIGFVGTSFVVMVDDARIWLKPYEGTLGANNVDEYYGSGGLDLFSPRTRLNLFTNFGGGVLPDANGGYGEGLPRYVRSAVIDVNLEGAVHARFSPSGRELSGVPDNALRYHWGVKLMSNNTIQQSAGDDSKGFGADERGSYLSFAEPSRRDVAIALTNITGDLAFANGTIDIVPHDNPGDTNANPKLRASHEFLIGKAASAVINNLPEMAAVAGDPAPLDIGHIKMGEQNLGRIVIPSAKAHATLTLEPIPIHAP